jgi:Peptidase MA superfamily/Tetratricopeptide repeat
MVKCAAVWLFLVFAIVAPAAGQVTDDKQAEAGWQALQQGDADRAATLFYDALSRNPRDPVLHFGAGAAAHLLGREGDAADSLKRALALNPKLTGAAELLGEIEYRQGDTESAIRLYEQVLTGATGGQAMRRRLDEWRKEAAVHEKLMERNDARFSVIFDGRSENNLATHSVAVLDRAFWRIGEKLGAYPPNRIFVTLYTEQQFRDLTHMPAWSAGAFDGKIRIPVQGVSRNMEEFDRILVHELTHAMIYGVAPRGVPAWLHEGLASYFEGRDPVLAQRRIQSLGVIIPLSALQDSFSRFNAAQAAVAYEESLFIADALAHQLGTQMVVLLQHLGNGQSFDESLGALGLRASDFESQVTRRLKP